MLVKCPHCNEEVDIIELNCGIFRHGIYKKDHKQLDPHAPKDLCDKVVRENLIYGCGKPFKVVDGIAISCEYI